MRALLLLLLIVCVAAYVPAICYSDCDDPPFNRCWHFCDQPLDKAMIDLLTNMTVLPRPPARAV